MCDCKAAVSVAPLSFAPDVNLLPLNGDQKLQTVTDDNGIKPCTVITCGIGLKVNFIISDVSRPIIGNATMEENSCFAIVKPPPFRSWIRDLRDLNTNAGSCMVKIGRHYYTHGLIIEGHAKSVTQTGEASVWQMHHFMKKNQMINTREMWLSHSTSLTTSMLLQWTYITIKW
eukprot:6492454-Amphidinium_carterae.3